MHSAFNSAFGNGEAGVARGAESLDLSHGDGAFVAVAGRVAPAAVRRGAGGELDAAVDDLFHPLAHAVIRLHAVARGEKHQRKAVAIHRIALFLRRPGDQAVFLNVARQILDDLGDVLGIRTARRRIAVGEKAIPASEVMATG